MNYIDLILIIPLLWAIYRGFTRGFIFQAASLAALILGIFGAIRFSSFTANILTNKFDLQTQYLSIISFAITFIAIVIAVHIIARIIDKLIKAIALGFINRILGIVFAVLKYAFIISIILLILNGINKRTNFLPKEDISNSVLYEPLSKFALKIFPYLDFNINENKDEENNISCLY